MTKPLTKVWTCPTCSTRFKAGGTRHIGKSGRTCPNGHFHSFHEIKRHEQGKPIRQDGYKASADSDRPVATLRPKRAHGRNDAQALAFLWLGAIDGLLAQMPERSLARAMIEGATAQAYRVSKKVINEQPADEQAERKAA
jgi:hypothetical protein